MIDLTAPLGGKVVDERKLLRGLERADLARLLDPAINHIFVVFLLLCVLIKKALG